MFAIYIYLLLLIKHWKFSILFNLITEKDTLFNFSEVSNLIYASNIICTHFQMITISRKKKKIKIEWEKVVPSNGNWEKELMTVN